MFRFLPIFSEYLQVFFHFDYFLNDVLQKLLYLVIQSYKQSSNGFKYVYCVRMYEKTMQIYYRPENMQIYLYLSASKVHIWFVFVCTYIYTLHTLLLEE